MADELYKVNISTDVMIYAKDTKEAVLLAKQKASDEVGAATYTPIQAQYVDQIPIDWLDYIPYCPPRIQQIGNKCKDMVVNRSQPEPQQPLHSPEHKPEPQLEPRPQPVKPEPQLPIPSNQSSLNFGSFVAGRRKIINRRK